MVDCHEAVKIGDLVKNLESRSVVEPKCTADLPRAIAREEADEPTLRRGEEGTQRTFINTTSVEDSRWGTAAAGRGFERLLPSPLQRHRK